MVSVWSDEPLGALAADGLALFVSQNVIVLDDEALSFSDFVTTRDVLARDNVAGFGIDILLLQAVSGLPVEAHLFR
jgi:hypothetical protein